MKQKAVSWYWRLEKTTALSMIDDSWKEHLREMDELKQAVQNAVVMNKKIL